LAVPSTQDLPNLSSVNPGNSGFRNNPEDMTKEAHKDPNSVCLFVIMIIWKQSKMLKKEGLVKILQCLFMKE
jgi:hypothetical protein